MFIVLCSDISLVLQTREISLRKTIHLISTGDPPFTCSCHNHQHDAHESLLKILDILHNHTKIDLFPCLAFVQEAMKYSSIIRNTFYGILNSSHTFTASKWITTNSSYTSYTIISK